MQASNIWIAGAGYIIATNAVAIFAFWWDKRCAIKGTRRTPEALLLKLALIGGSAGAKYAQARFRHKTRKEPFRTMLNTICVLHVAAIFAGLWWLWAA